MATAYLLPSEIVLFYDSRRVLGLASDDPDTPATLAALSNSASAPYALVDAQITFASGEFDLHVQQGRRYRRSDLEAIVAAYRAAPTDIAVKKRAWPIMQLVADLAFGALVGRRGMNSDRLTTLAPRYEAAQAALEKLALGITVLDIDANLDAGKPSVVTIGQNVYRPSVDNPMFGYWSQDPQLDSRYFGRW